MTFALIALLISWETGWFALEILWPQSRRDASEFAARGAIAGGLGLAISSVLFFLCLALGVVERPWVVVFDVAALGGFAWLARRRPVANHPDTLLDVTSTSSFDWLMRGGLLVAVLANANAWFVRFRDEPLGFWDAFAIWNLKARFFFIDGGEHWQRAFSNVIAWSHTDYPLLLPLNVARLWTYAGSAAQEVSALLSVFFVILALALLFGVVASLADAALGYLAAFTFLAAPAFIAQATWQVADIPLAFFLAAASGLVFIAQRSDSSRPTAFVVAGLCAGSAALTKNEGLLFALTIPIAISIAGGRTGMQARLLRALDFLKGLALPLAVLLVVKIVFAGDNDLASDFSIASLSRVFDVTRHSTILVSFARSLVMLTGVPLLALFAALLLWQRIRNQLEVFQAVAPIALALSLQIAGYYFIYLITERDLAWHLGTSNLRLFVQLWPSALLLFFASLRPFTIVSTQATTEVGS